MDEPHLQDVIRRGLGRAATIIGGWCDAYRPHGPDDPISPENRTIRLNAAFSADHGFAHPVGYGQATWHGIFDAAYTRPGDYIVRRQDRRGRPADGIWFIAAQQPLAPILCVRATRLASFARPAAPSAPGLNAYGGVTAGQATSLARNWPTSVLTGGGGGMDAAGLPADAPPGAWSVLLPVVAGVVFRSGDLMTDDLGRTGVVAAAERTDLGWRMLVKQATT
jgi:hypothetical protein